MPNSNKLERFNNLEFIKEESVDEIKKEMMDMGDEFQMEDEYIAGMKSNDSAFLKIEPFEWSSIIDPTSMTTAAALKTIEDNKNRNSTLMVEVEQIETVKSKKRMLTPMATCEMLEKTVQLNKTDKLEINGNLPKLAKLPTLPTAKIKTFQQTPTPLKPKTIKALQQKIQRNKKMNTIPKRNTSEDQQNAAINILNVSNNVASSEIHKRVPRTEDINYNVVSAHNGTQNLSHMTGARFQNDTQENNRLIKSCGLLQFCYFRKMYTLKYLYCDRSYKPWNFKKMIRHLETKHTTEMNFKEFPCNNSCEEKEDNSLLLVEINGDGVHEIEDEYMTDSDESSLSLNFNEIDFNVDYIKINEIDRCLNKKCDSQQPQAAIIDFEKSDGNKILTFLKMLRLQPMIWHTRRHGPSLWDEQAKTFLQDFDANMSITDLRKSLDNARSLYRYFKQNKHQAEENVKFHQYGTLLKQIAMLSKTFIFECENCDEYFFDGDNLLSHEFVRHKIQHFPYKCESCGVRFSSSKVKQKHVKLHNFKAIITCSHDRLKSKHFDCIEIRLPFKCEKCNKRFKSYKPYQKHNLIHNQANLKKLS